MLTTRTLKVWWFWATQFIAAIIELIVPTPFASSTFSEMIDALGAMPAFSPKLES